MHAQPTEQPASRFERLTINCPHQIIGLFDEAAARNFQSRSEYTRRAVIERLRADGVLVSGPEAKGAGGSEKSPLPKRKP